MTALASRSMPAIRPNWPRVGALSGSFSLHLYVLALLLTPPIASQLLKRVQSDPLVVDIFRVIPKEVKPVPDPPTPVRRETRPHAEHYSERIEHADVKSVTESVVPITAIDSTSPVTFTAPATSLDVAPTALAYGTRTRVTYPREALRRHEQGTVVLRVLVGADGIAQTVEIETSSGSPRLDSAARDAVMHWNFRPGTRDGAAHSAWARVPIAFDLSSL